MKPTYKPFLTSALALAVAVPAMAQEEAEQQELVNAAFRKVAAEDQMGGSTTLNVHELMEKNYNDYALDHLEGYVGGWNGASLWGQSGYLTLVDGVRRDANNVLPEEIEDITFMKGAQAVVLYGSQAAKGVMLITTKRGQKDDLHVAVRANTGWNVAKALPKYLGATEYMTLYNEARLNDGKQISFSPDQIYGTFVGDNPYKYPDIDYYSSDYINKSFNRWDVSAELEGGNQLVRFYSLVNYYREGDYVNFGEAKNNYTDRLSVRGNVDIKFSDYIKGFVNASASYYDSHSPQGGSYWEAASKMRPNRVAPFIPLSYIDPNAKEALGLAATSANIKDGMFPGGTQEDKTNIFADYYFGGKSQWTSRQFQFDAGISIDLQKVLKGLSFHTQMSVDYATSYSQSFENKYRIFAPTWSNFNGHEAIVALNNYETKDRISGTQNISGSVSNNVMAVNAHLDYNRTFADDHNVSAMVVANGWQRKVSGEYHRTSNANLGFMASYNYQHKYYLDLSGSVNHSAKLPKDNRQGLSKSVALGWNIAKESWMKDSNFDNLKLTASLSSLVTDVDISGYYDYLGTYKSGAWWDWNGGSGHPINYSVRGGNSSFDFVERNEFNVGLQGSILNQKVAFDVNYFYTNINGLPINNDNLTPSYFKAYYPESSFYSILNYNNDNYQGVDFSVNYKDMIGNVELQAGLNGTYYTTRATRREETTIADDYQKRQGRYLDGIWGYECLGFFKDEADIAQSPTQKIGDQQVRPGDLKYRDVNGDGQVDSHDTVELGKYGWYGNPFTLGLNLSAKYKGFTLFVLATAGFEGRAMKVNPDANNDSWKGYFSSGTGENKYSVAVRDRAIIDHATNTVTNLDTARYPRLTTDAGTNNIQHSTFWMYNTDRLDLAKVQFTYDFADALFANSKVVKGISLYVSGSNLLTIAGEKDLLELNVGSAPQSRFYNMGIKVQF